jgi:hypothetical protein
MQGPWESFQSVAAEAIDALWYDFAKQGSESDAFAPMAKYPRASAWLAESMSLSENYITRKLGAMLAGWVIDPAYAGLLTKMLERERKVFFHDSLSGNSVGEDIMFAATRWAWCENAKIKNAGTEVLARMIWDAIDTTPWNTANWAAANLYRATAGKHPIFDELRRATEKQLEGQRFLQNVVKALRENDEKELSRFVTPPSEARALKLDDPRYAMVRSLWDAAAAVERSG